jgi:methylphosphotriester-DNA--protein-cysteine methyltransferase
MAQEIDKYNHVVEGYWDRYTFLRACKQCSPTTSSPGVMAQEIDKYNHVVEGYWDRYTFLRACKQCSPTTSSPGVMAQEIDKIHSCCRGLLGSLYFPKSLQAILSNHLFVSIQYFVASPRS